MAKKKKNKDEVEPEPVQTGAVAQVEPQPEAETDTSTRKPKGKTDAAEVTVCDPRGNPHRTYSFEVHGEKFADLAAEFISDRKGWTVR